jgi:hypothetical protein
MVSRYVVKEAGAVLVPITEVDSLLHVSSGTENRHCPDYILSKQQSWDTVPAALEEHASAVTHGVQRFDRNVVRTFDVPVVGHLLFQHCDDDCAEAAAAKRAAPSRFMRYGGKSYDCSLLYSRHAESGGEVVLREYGPLVLAAPTFPAAAAASATAAVCSAVTMSSQPTIIGGRGDVKRLSCRITPQNVAGKRLDPCGGGGEYHLAHGRINATLSSRRPPPPPPDGVELVEGKRAKGPAAAAAAAAAGRFGLLIDLRRPAWVTHVGTAGEIPPASLFPGDRGGGGGGGPGSAKAAAAAAARRRAAGGGGAKKGRSWKKRARGGRVYVVDKVRQRARAFACVFACVRACACA